MDQASNMVRRAIPVSVPKNLSLSTSAAAVQDFYLPIHRRMADRGLHTRALRPTVREFVDTLQQVVSQCEGMALDAGCGGTAALTHACAEHGFRAVYGLDLSHANLIHARTVTAARPSIQFCRGSVTSLPFPDTSFDFVVCSGVVHHTPDPERCIRELARVLKPGGSLYVSVYCFADSAFEWGVRAIRQTARIVSFDTLHRTIGRHRAVNNFLLDHMYVPLLWLFRAEEVRALLHGAGLTVQREFASRMDPFGRYGVAGRWISGDGLLRVWVCGRR
jgi:ubiquinone/menaquinone biosynthesis C-methylase UbiE